MNSLCIERNSNEHYVYLINAALVFGVLYGYYTLDYRQDPIYFESKSLACGETATQYFPDYATDIDIRVDASYIFWVRLYRKCYCRMTENLCLLTTGWVGETRCDEISCSSSIVKPPQPNNRLTYGGDSVPLLNRNYNSDPSRCEITKPHREIYTAASDNSYTSNLHNICNNSFRNGYDSNLNNNLNTNYYSKRNNSVYLRDNIEL